MNFKYPGLSAALLSLTLFSSLSFAQEVPARTGSDTNTIPLNTDYGTVQTRNGEREAEAGYFTNSAGAQGGTVRLNVRRIFGLGSTTEGTWNRGVMLDPGVRLRIDATDSAIPRREIEVNGIGAWRIHGRDLNGREALTVEQQVAVAALNEAALTKAAAVRVDQEAASALARAEALVTGSLPRSAADHAGYYDSTPLAVTRMAQAIEARPNLTEADAQEICDATYEGRGQVQVRYSYEEQTACRTAVMSPIVATARAAFAASRQATRAAEVAKRRYDQALARAQALLPLDGNEVSDDHRTTANATGEIVAGHASFVHRYNAWTGLNQTGALIQAVQASGHTAVKINGRNVDFCGHISPAGAILGNNSIGTSNRAAMYRFYAMGCVGLNLGPVGHLRDEANVELMFGEGHSVSFSNFAGLDRIGGTPLGAGYRYEIDHTGDGANNIRVNNTHLGVVQASF